MDGWREARINGRSRTREGEFSDFATQCGKASPGAPRWPSSTGLTSPAGAAVSLQLGLSVTFQPDVLHNTHTHTS